MKIPALFARKAPQAPTPGNPPQAGNLLAGLLQTAPPPGARLRATTPSTALDLFTLKTGRDTWLTLEGAEAAMAAEPTTPLLLAIPKAAPQCCVLIAPDARSFAVEGDGMRAPAISVRLRRCPGGRIELRHPIAGNRYLGIVTGAPVGKPNRVLFDRTGDKTLDRFTPHQADPTLPTADAQALLEELAAALHPPLRANTLLDLLQTGTLRPALAEPLIRLLPPDELDILARRLLANPADLTLIRHAIPNDPWLNTTLPQLIAWLAADRPPTTRATSPATEDHVAVLQSGDLRPQAGLATLAMARRTIAPRRLACVLATARNEGPYILDWIAHHRACGFDHAIIYSNDNDDGSDDLLALLADANEITWVQNHLSPAARAQWKAYGHAFKSLPDPLDFRWTMVLDLDEYVGFRTDLFATLGDLIGWQEFQPFDALAMRWLTFAASRTDTWHDAPSTRRFLQREPAISPLFKTLARSNLFWDAHCHFPYPTMNLPFSYRLEDGTPCHHMARVAGGNPPPEAISTDTAWIAHHPFRSAAEALVKASRGDATWNAATRADGGRLDAIVRRFVSLANNPNLITDDRTLHSARSIDTHLARLHALPGIATCDAALKHRYAARLAALSSAFVQVPIAGERAAEYTALQNILRAQIERRRAA